METYVIGSDHAGFLLKEKIKEFLLSKKIEVIDCGAESESISVDYPDFAKCVSEKVASNKSYKGILICGTGIGMSISANKIKGIRAALCCNPYMARMAKEHNDANVLCISARRDGANPVSFEETKTIVDAFVGTDFSHEERHKKRVDKINNL